MYIQCTSPGDGQTSCKVWLASGERRWCSNEANKRNPLKFAGVSQSGKPISAANGPKFTILWDMSRIYCSVTIFLSIVDTCLSCEVQLRRYSTTKLCDGAQMANFWRFFCVLYFQRAACSTFQTCILNSHYGHTMCGSMVHIQFPTAENRRGKKEEKEERRNHRTKILWLALFYRAAIMTVKQQMRLC